MEENIVKKIIKIKKFILILSICILLFLFTNFKMDKSCLSSFMTKIIQQMNIIFI